jgi:hypothetical protein
MHASEDQDHFDACHARWSRTLNRSTASPEYRDEWYESQCGACRYYVRLDGLFSADYGACTNAASAFDGSVLFEHDGCEQFEYSGW